MTPEQAAAQPDGIARFDRAALGRAISERAELDGLLALFRRLLKPDGLFILGDIVPPQLAAPMAALALLRFGAQNGFFWAAVGGLMRIFVSDYLKCKSKVGLSHYEEARR